MIKKNKTIIILVLAAALSSIIFLNITVTSKYGKNYQGFKHQLPLYLKVLNFYNRHFNYMWLTEKITGHVKTKKEKVLRLFQWVYETMHRQPKGLPVMDDHVWNIYVRGYGTSNQFADLFSTLCHYIGANSFFEYITINDHSIFFTFVEIARGWVVFDPFNGVYFNNKNGNLATIKEIEDKNWNLINLEPSDIKKSAYEPFLEILPNIAEQYFKRDISLHRGNIQSPINRLKFQLKNWLSGKTPLIQ